MRRLLTCLSIAALIFTAGLVNAEEKPRVTFETDLGTVVIELFPEEAPITVENFLRYANDGFYTGTIFHRVIPNFVVQGGGLTFDFMRKETRAPIKNESDNGLKNTKGTLSMARLPDPDSATSQFFINLNNNRHLNPKKDEAGYAVFGKVVDGMDVVVKITEEPRGKSKDQAPNLPIRILAVSVEPESARNIVSSDEETDEVPGKSPAN
ncbi:MAG: peptidylprolyl isomerase [Cellvibrionaceae bacterium]